MNRTKRICVAGKNWGTRDDMKSNLYNPVRKQKSSEELHYLCIKNMYLIFTLFQIHQRTLLLFVIIQYLPQLCFSVLKYSWLPYSPLLRISIRCEGPFSTYIHTSTTPSNINNFLISHSLFLSCRSTTPRS